MSDLLQTGEAWLEAQRRAHMAHTVTYSRGEDSVDVPATVGHTPFEQVGEYGVSHRIESRDFIVTTADLVLAEVETLPLAGDQIRETQGAVVYVHEVMSPGGEPPFRFTGPERISLRIHTKFVDTE